MVAIMAAAAPSHGNTDTHTNAHPDARSDADGRGLDAPTGGYGDRATDLHIPASPPTEIDVRSSRNLMRLRTMLLALSLAIVPATASAIGVDPAEATPVQREQAQARFVKGRQKYDSGNYKDALAEFQASIDIVQSPNTRLYVARSFREMGRLVEAYVEFGRTMVEAKEHAAADGRYAKAAEAAANERKQMEPYLGFATVNVQNASQESKLTVGGQEIKRGGWFEPVPVMPGQVEVRVDTPNHPSAAQTVKVAAGQKVDVSVDANATTSAPAVPVDRPISSSSTNGTFFTPLRIGAIAAGGVGLVGMVMFAVAGPMSLGTYSDLETRCGKNTPCPQPLQGEVSRGKTEQTVANVGLAIGIVGFVAAGALFGASMVIKPANKEGASTSLVFGPGSVTLHGTF